MLKVTKLFNNLKSSGIRLKWNKNSHDYNVKIFFYIKKYNSWQIKERIKTRKWDNRWKPEKYMITSVKTENVKNERVNNDKERDYR